MSANLLKILYQICIYNNVLWNSINLTMYGAKILFDGEVLSTETVIY